MRRVRRRVYEILDVGRKDDRLSEYTDIALITLICERSNVVLAMKISI